MKKIVKVNFINRSFTDNSIIPKIEDIMTKRLGYKVWIEEILLAPRTKEEEEMKNCCIRLLAQYKQRIKKTLSYNHI